MRTGTPEEGCGRRVSDILPRAADKADWERFTGLYHQAVQVAAGGSRRVPDELRENLADAVLQLSWSYVGREADLSEHALAVLANVEHRERFDARLFCNYYGDDRFSVTKESQVGRHRRPSVYENVVETCRRLRDAERVRHAFRHTETSGILTGSASYGRFYNVRGNRCGHPASDLDFIIVVEDAAALDSVAESLATLPGISKTDVDQFVRRSYVFRDAAEDATTVLSHKIRLWSDGVPDPMLPSGAAEASYPLSLHVMTRTVLDYALVTSAPQIRKNGAGARRTLQDYRESPAARLDDIRNFAGKSLSLDLESTPTEHGYMRLTRVYHIDEFDFYYPGFFQTMLLPRPDVLWDRFNVRSALEVFQGKLADRLRHEARRNAHTMLRLSFAHIRREAFAPRTVKILDEDYSP